MSALQTEIAGLAMTAAQKIMQENTDGQELYDRFLEETGGANEKTAKNHLRLPGRGDMPACCNERKVPAEDIEETRNLFAQTPELLEVLTNPTIFIAK